MSRHENETPDEVTPDEVHLTEAQKQSDVGHFLLYTLSLPERSVRSAVAMAAGAVKETGEFLVPKAFQSTKTWEVVVKNSLEFLTRNVGGAKSCDAPDAENDPTASDDFVARKAVGNFVDFAGMATLHASPLWVLAIVSDIAYGTKTYVKEHATELQANGLIDDTSTIHSVDDVLTAVQEGTGKAATLFDTPPLSVDDLKATLDETRAAVISTDFTSVLPASEIRKTWDEMKEIAEDENISLLGVSGAVTMSALNKAGSVAEGAITGVVVAGSLVNKAIFGHYTEALTRIHDHGYYATVRDCCSPYLGAVSTNFAPTTDTLTQKIASGRAFAGVLGRIRGWFGGARTPEAEIEETDRERDEG